MRGLVPCVALLGLVSTSAAKVVNYDWTVGWVRAAPDGFSRPVIGINGKWPLPKLEADLGDTVIVKVTNNLGNETTGIHWHGQFQQGSANMVRVHVETKTKSLLIIVYRTDPSWFLRVASPRVPPTLTASSRIPLGPRGITLMLVVNILMVFEVLW